MCPQDHIQAITDALINACHNKYAVTKTTTLNDDEIIRTVSDLFGAGMYNYLSVFKVNDD